MKIFLLFLPVLFIFFVSCDFDEFPCSGGGFTMTIGHKVALTANDIDYYDLSTHFIYLKGDNSFLTEKLYRDSFQVYANWGKIYSGVFSTWYSSSMPYGPAIYVPVTFYGNYLVPITFWNIVDESGKPTHADPRSDPHIIQALKSHNQLHVGLKGEVRSVEFNPGNQVKLKLELINDDSFNYYYLDPEKMGLALFHYFTNGLSFWSPTQFKSFTNHIQHIQPEPWDSWKMEWLSLIRSNERKIIQIDYPEFDVLTSGSYKLNFSFPGLSHVEKKDLVRSNGRIWLGELQLSKDIIIR